MNDTPEHINDPQDWQKALDRIEQARADGGKSVDLSYLKIQDIPDALLALAPTLETLVLRGTPITAAAPLERLTNLAVLVLRGTPITDAAPLERLTNLTTLDLSRTPITDAAPLEGLTNLTTLSLDHTQITDAAPLEGLTNLTRLDLDGTDISDAAPLEGLTNLTTLSLSHTQITDAAPLEGLTNLTTLSLSHTQITDAAPLAGLTNLTTLGLSNTQITTAAPLEGLTNLTELDLSDTQITDAAPLERLTNLTALDLYGTQITTAAPLQGLTNLTTLGLSRTPITDAAPLAGLTNLTTLVLGRTQITDAAPLERLTNLTTLYLNGTDITDATPLEGLTNLTTLYLSSTQITDAAPLEGLTNLTELYLSHTQITDARPLAALTRLNTLDVAQTPIIDLRPVRTLTALATGGGPPNFGLGFRNCAATRFDAQLDDLSQIEGHEERTEKTLEYLRGLDDAEYDRRLLEHGLPPQTPAPIMPVWTEGGQMDNTPEALDHNKLAKEAWTTLYELAHSLDTARLANTAPNVKKAIEQVRHGLGQSYETLNAIHTGIFAKIAAHTISEMDQAAFDDEAPFYQAFALQAVSLINRFPSWQTYSKDEALARHDPIPTEVIDTTVQIKEIFGDCDILTERLSQDFDALTRAVREDTTHNKVIEHGWATSTNNMFSSFFEEILKPGLKDGLKKFVSGMAVGVCTLLAGHFLILAMKYPVTFGWLKAAASFVKTVADKL